MKERLRQFFAVTLTSVYRVSDEKDANGVPVVEKIAQRDRSEVSVGGRLKNGRLVAVTRRGIFLYDEDFSPFSGPRKRLQRLEEVNTMFWGAHTSPLIALFLEEADARKCLVWGSDRELDPLWWNFTRETLAAIGDDHPTFVLSDHPSFAFIFE